VVIFWGSWLELELPPYRLAQKYASSLAPRILYSLPRITAGAIP
jgi:hypothetical protein